MRKQWKQNSMDESTTEAAILNDPHQAQLLQQLVDEHNSKSDRVCQRREAKNSPFMKEAHLVRALRQMSIVDWIPDDAEAFAVSRLLARKDMQEYIRLLDLDKQFKQDSGVAFNNASRDLLAEFALRHATNALQPEFNLGEISEPEELLRLSML